MRSDLDPADESIGPTYAEGPIPGTPARIYLVGTMRAVAPSGADLLPRGRKTRGLLACLCLAQGDRVSRSRLVGLFWDRSADPQARMSLRQSLSELNGIVNRHVPGLIEIGRDSVRIDIRKCWVDALAILDASADPTTDISNLVQPLQRAPPRRSRRDYALVRPMARGRADAVRGSRAEDSRGGTRPPDRAERETGSARCGGTATDQLRADPRGRRAQPDEGFRPNGRPRPGNPRIRALPAGCF